MYKASLLFAILLSGCATGPTLPDLMRSSYYVGCGEARLKTIPKPLQKHDAQVKGVLQLCEDASKKFDLRQTGIYDERMELYYKPRTREIK